MPIRLAIVEDNGEVRATLERMIARDRSLRCVCSCATGASALQTIPVHAPEVVIMDIRLPDISGIECIARLKRMLPATQFLVYTVHGDTGQVFKALGAGASGYLLKRSTRAEILHAIAEVRQGGAPMTGEVARLVAQSFRNGQGDTALASDRLTSREEEVLTLLAQGYAADEIAGKLVISFDTVRFHVKDIYGKLHVRSHAGAIMEYLG